MLTSEDTVKRNEQQLEEVYEWILLNKLYEKLGVQIIGNVSQPLQGSTTANIMQETDKGKLLIRIYSKQMQQKLETGNPFFEIEALNFFVNHSVNVPIPLKFSDKLYAETENYTFFGYFFIPGSPIQRTELSINLAESIGEFLCNFLDVSALYSPRRSNEDVFINSFAYILNVADKVENLYPELKELDIWITMKEITKVHVNILNHTPKGIVHADYFYENILKDDGTGNVIGLIDFGDAYYGYILHDLVIGAMEVCILDGEVWDLEILAVFLKATSPFLRSNSISFEQFFETLRADCLRFAAYTVSFSYRNDEMLESNAYINRYKKLLSKSFKEKLCEVFHSCLNKSSKNVLED